MTRDRLTRQEISWLLAQEARGAARALRDGLRAPPSSLPGSAPVTPPMVSGLEALDNAIGLMDELHSGITPDRRGRIDLASLVYEVAPEARITIAPGLGTEVFGQLNELRRMLHVLVSQASGPSMEANPEIAIEREGDDVHISVELGPDTSPNADLERRWISRMATRHGGRLELARGRQTVILPADGTSEKREVAELRRELQEAQELGEAYARELASTLLAAEERRNSIGSLSEPPAVRYEEAAALARAMKRTLKTWMEEMRGEINHASKWIHDEELRDGLQRRLRGGAELVTDVSTLAELPDAELPRETAVSDIFQKAADQVAARGSRRNVEVESRIDPELKAVLRPESTSALLRSLLAHGIAATPDGGKLTVAARVEQDHLELSVTDGGPAVPASARSDLIQHRIDPSQIGRPVGVSLTVANAIASHLGGGIGVRTDASGATALWCSLPLVGCV